MRVRVKGGVPANFFSRGYKTLEPVYSTMESVEYLKKQIVKRKNHRLSCLELKHHIDKETSNKNICEHECTYLIFDATAKEIMVIDGMAKGYVGEGPRGALTIDAYLQLLNVPLSRTVLCKEMIQRFNNQKTINVPKQSKLKFSLDKLNSVRRNARMIGLRLREPGGFDKLYHKMPIEDMVNALDFHSYGHWTSYESEVERASRSLSDLYKKLEDKRKTPFVQYLLSSIQSLPINFFAVGESPLEKEVERTVDEINNICFSDKHELMPYLKNNGKKFSLPCRYFERDVSTICHNNIAENGFPKVVCKFCKGYDFSTSHSNYREGMAEIVLIKAGVVKANSNRRLF